MKKILFAALAATTLFAACSKDDTGTNVATGEGVLMITLPGSTTTRAIEGQVVAESVAPAIFNAVVFLANSGTGAIVKYDVFSEGELGDGKKRIEQVPNAVDKVIVVANFPIAPNAEFTDPASLATYESVVNYAFTIAGQHRSAGIADKTLMGEGTPVIPILPDEDPNPDGHNYRQASIKLNSITARFEIGTVTPGTGVATVNLLGVWMNNFYRNGARRAIDIVFNDWDSPYWDITPVAPDGPVGTDPGPVTFIPPYSCEALYYTAGSGSVTLDNASQVYAYHVFTGPVIPHLILLVKGTTTDGSHFLGWVTYKHYGVQGGGRIQIIEPNAIYRVGVGAKGIEINIGDITPDPEMDYDLGIECTIAPWTVKDVDPLLN